VGKTRCPAWEIRGGLHYQGKRSEPSNTAKESNRPRLDLQPGHEIGGTNRGRVELFRGHLREIKSYLQEKGNALRRPGIYVGESEVLCPQVPP